MKKHSKPVHDDKKVKFRMEVIKSFKNNPLARQVFESILIVKSKSEDEFPLNDKKRIQSSYDCHCKIHKRKFLALKIDLPKLVPIHSIIQYKPIQSVDI